MVSYRCVPGAVAAAQTDTVLLVVPGRKPVALEGVDVTAFSAVMGAATFPITETALRELCDDSTIARMLDLGALAACSDDELQPASAENPRKKCRRLTVAVSGSVQAATFVPYIVALADTFAEHVDIIITRGATRFIRARVFAYYGMRVWTDQFRPTHDAPVPHTYLATADLVLVAPASAATLHRLASGACNDLASLVVAMTTAPVVVAPSMNGQMWKNPAIQRNAAQLRADGVWVIEPGVAAEVSARSELSVGGIPASPDRLVRMLEAVLVAKSRQ